MRPTSLRAIGFLPNAAPGLGAVPDLRRVPAIIQHFLFNDFAAIDAAERIDKSVMLPQGMVDQEAPAFGTATDHSALHRSDFLSRSIGGVRSCPIPPPGAVPYSAASSYRFGARSSYTARQRRLAHGHSV